MWQWLNSWLPWWPFQSLSAANLLNSFYSPLPLHKVPHQLRPDYLSLSLVWPGPTLFTHCLSLTNTLIPSESNQTNQSLPIAPFHIPFAVKKWQLLPLWKPSLHFTLSILNYFLSVFHKAGPSLPIRTQHRRGPLFFNRFPDVTFWANSEWWDKVCHLWCSNVQDGGLIFFKLVSKCFGHCSSVSLEPEEIPFGHNSSQYLLPYILIANRQILSLWCFDFFYRVLVTKVVSPFSGLLQCLPNCASSTWKIW